MADYWGDYLVERKVILMVVLRVLLMVVLKVEKMELR